MEMAGKKVKRTKGEGCSEPEHYPRKPKNKDGQMKPHTWTINRKTSL